MLSLTFRCGCCPKKRGVKLKVNTQFFLSQKTQIAFVVDTQMHKHHTLKSRPGPDFCFQRGGGSGSVSGCRHFEQCKCNWKKKIRTSPHRPFSFSSSTFFWNVVVIRGARKPRGRTLICTVGRMWCSCSLFSLVLFPMALGIDCTELLAKGPFPSSYNSK